MQPLEVSMFRTKMIPKVTVYITNYNYGSFLRQSIDSVLEQTFQDYELIIIDDGSIDESRKIKEYENKPKIQIIFQNKVLLFQIILHYIMQRRIYYRLDADDYFDKNTLKLL